jgi:serine protease Do
LKSGHAAALVLAGALSLAACATTAGGDSQRAAPSYEKLKLAELQSLAQSEPAKALEAIASLQDGDGNGPIPGRPTDEELFAVAAPAEAKIQAAFRDSLSSKDFAGALAALDSLKALSEDEKLASLLTSEASAEASAWKDRRSAILAQEAEDFYSKGQSAPALLVYLAALDGGGSDSAAAAPAELALWAGRALEVKDRRSLSYLLKEMASRSLPPLAGADEFLASRDTMAAMRSGVITIRVDKGIKIEQGLGTPDRVLGTGFFIDRSGYALTNYHVIASEVDPKYEGYSHMTVKRSNSPEERVGAKVVGYDKVLDLALIKVDAVPEYVFSLSDGLGLLPGQRINVIGSPAGLEDTVTTGIVSAIGRKILQIGDAIQVDAALNPGNSGGPLLDESGSVLGVVFAGMPQFQGLNFAIPSAWIIRALPSLFRGGELRRAWLGIALAEKEEGPPVPGIEVTYRHPAVASGISQGDRLLEISGLSPKDLAAAQELVSALEPGSLARVKVERDGKERYELRYVAERPFSPLDSATKLDRQDRLFPALFGMALTPMPSTLFEASNYSVAKVWPGSIADESGLSENDPISLKRFFVDREQNAVIIQIYVKKRKAGFLESIIQIPASLEIPDFI